MIDTLMLLFQTKERSDSGSHPEGLGLIPGNGTTIGWEWYLHQDLHLDFIQSGPACYYCTIETIMAQVSLALLKGRFPF